MLATVDVIASILMKIAQIAPTVIQTVEDLRPLASDIQKAAAGETMTPEQKAALEARVEDLYGRLQQPLSPE